MGGSCQAFSLASQLKGKKWLTNQTESLIFQSPLKSYDCQVISHFFLTVSACLFPHHSSPSLVFSKERSSLCIFCEGTDTTSTPEVPPKTCSELKPGAIAPQQGSTWPWPNGLLENNVSFRILLCKNKILRKLY